MRQKNHSLLLDGVTLGFRMEEPAPDRMVRTIRSRDDSAAWWNENVEFFLDVTGRGEGEYYQFIINPNGAVYDSRLQDTNWDAEGTRVGVHVGTDFWSMEVHLPYGAFTDLVRPGTGVEWLGQFTRHRMSRMTATPGKGFDQKGETTGEYSRMNMRFGGGSNNQADFARLRFVE